MQMEPHVKARITRNIVFSLGLYALPVVLMFAALALTGSHPWEHIRAAHQAAAAHATGPWSWLRLERYGLVVFTLLLGVAEFACGLYEERWTRNERTLDIACFILPKLLVGPAVAWFSLKLLPLVMPLGLLHHRCR